MNLKRRSLSVCILLLIIYSCNKTDLFDSNRLSAELPIEKFKVSVNKKSLDHFSVSYRTEKELLTYQASEKYGVTESSFKVIDIVDNKDVIEIRFTIDTTLQGYKFVPYKSIIETAKQLKTRYSRAQIEDLEKIFEKFGEEVLATNTEIINSQLLLSLFFHKAIFNTVKRSLKNNDDCDCTPSPLYFIGKTGFWCQEDFMIKTQTILDNKSKETLTEKEKEVFRYLEANKSKSSIPLDQILSILETKETFLARVEYFRANAQSSTKASGNSFKIAAESSCTPGDAWGCCGNYSGCCWVWDWVCFAHDQDCFISKCKPIWYCLPGCQYP